MKDLKWIVIVLTLAISMSTITMTDAAYLGSRANTFKEPGGTLNKQVEFKDEKLEQIVREKLNQPLGAIYQSSLEDIESIVEYDAQNEYLDKLMPSGYDEEKEIESLKGIEYIPNLAELELTSTIKLEDVESLEKLSQLKKLKLNIPLEYDLDFLKELESLEELDLITVESVKTIGELTNLKKLAIKTEAYDLSKLSSLKNLIELSIDVCNTKNPEIFSFLTDLDSIKKLKIHITTTDLILGKVNTKYLKELKNLEEFELFLESNHSSDDRVKDLSFLIDFKDLTKLSLSRTSNTSGEIDNIDDIGDFEKLKELKIDPQVYELEDLEPLKPLVHLEKLDLRRHTIEDLEPLEDMSKLEELYLSANEGDINSLKPLENLKNLKVLKLSIPNPYKNRKDGHKLDDVDSLENLRELEDIEIVGYRIDDISWVMNLSNLKSVDLSYNEIKDISSMKGLDNIERVNLSENHIGDINPIIHDGLEVLECAGNEIDNITFKQKMIELKGLDISHNNLKTINGVENIPNISQLGFSGNNIKDIDFLKNMVNLNELAADSNDIANIDVLSKLINLKKLGIGKNRIEDITPIFNLVHLQVMNVDEKDQDEILKDGIVWKKLPKLGRFYVNYGRIYTRDRYNTKPETDEKSKTTYRGRVYLDDGVIVPQEGLVVNIFKISKGGMGGSRTKRVIKEIMIPHDKKSVEYEFDIENVSGTWRLSYSIDMEVNNVRYELKTDTDFKFTDIPENQVIDNSDIEILERAKISGKLVLDDKILNMKVDEKVYNADTREIAIYVRINGEKRRTIASANVKQKEIDYELYLPKELKDKDFTLEYVIKKNGFFDFIPHVGVEGEVLLNGFLTGEKTLSPNIDKSMKMMFKGEDMVISDILVEMQN